ncbi:Bug family tripartite tricarboxylate transporter substrate binding protein [Muricoccus aerilatus]|uniref:Bug family tripartite tricarboxylate transporter substrate binding protein n=1 Tax=Muricoccus aerilatus TaxID=452982 RepID=UPI0005C23915|nr:tripartite tricarboxylate transporter substrate binding protein [Roseomonas aerilata]
MTATHIGRRAVIGAAMGLAVAPCAVAQSPKRVVKIMVGFPPGQATDTVARLWVERLAPHSPDNFIVDNRPGQGGSIALGQLARATPDGTTMMLAHMSALCTNPHFYRNTPYNTLKDFDAAGLVGDLPFVLVANPSIPVSNLEELVRYARANPGRLTNASSGNGTVSHLAMEELKRLTGMEITHVPYRGSSLGVTDVIAGTVSLALETATSTSPHIQSGRLKAIAAGTEKRLASLPDVPTLMEQGISLTAVTWLMAIYPHGLERETLVATHAAINATLRGPEIEERLLSIGAVPRYSSSPEEAEAYMRSEFVRWGEIVRRNNVPME